MYKIQKNPHQFVRKRVLEEEIASNYVSTSQ
jgi:hypothetical protein